MLSEFKNTEPNLVNAHPHALPKQLFRKKFLGLHMCIYPHIKILSCNSIIVNIRKQRELETMKLPSCCYRLHRAGAEGILRC